MAVVVIILLGEAAVDGVAGQVDSKAFAFVLNLKRAAGINIGGQDNGLAARDVPNGVIQFLQRADRNIPFNLRGKLAFFPT